ncbi:MAG: TIGR01620 family protein [Rhodobacterales bacterium]|nr:MAG: TIGR01620 family protein [Rhodobacterales bacterium]
MSHKNNAPVLIELDQPENETPTELTPATAPEVPETDRPTGQTMQVVTRVVARKPSALTRWFWAVLLALLGFALSVAAWDFVTGMIARNPYLGSISIALMGMLVLVLLALALRELSGFWRLKKLDRLHRAAEQAIAEDDLKAALHVTDGLVALYHKRPETEWGRANFAEKHGDQFDAHGLLGLAETEILAPLDQMAIDEISAAARQVATVTAIVPLALADVVVALAANVRMIRRIAEIYGGRAGTLGSWRLARSVFAHLVATGAVAVGDDMISSLAGGGMLSKISRRFGEGVINGTLTARVGVAAMEVCRPVPFIARSRPSVSGIVKQALKRLFGSKS